MTYRDPQCLFGKISTFLTKIISIQRIGRIFDVSFALLKWPHLHRAYLLGLWFSFSVTVHLTLFSLSSEPEFWPHKGVFWSKTECIGTYCLHLVLCNHRKFWRLLFLFMHRLKSTCKYLQELRNIDIVCSINCIVYHGRQVKYF